MTTITITVTVQELKVMYISLEKKGWDTAEVWEQLPKSVQRDLRKEGYGYA